MRSGLCGAEYPEQSAVPKLASVRENADDVPGALYLHIPSGLEVEHPRVGGCPVFLPPERQNPAENSRDGHGSSVIERASVGRAQEIVTPIAEVTEFPFNQIESTAVPDASIVEHADGDIEDLPVSVSCPSPVTEQKPSKLDPLQVPARPRPWSASPSQKDWSKTKWPVW